MAESAAQKLNESSAKTERALENEMQKLVGTDAFSRLLAETMGSTMGAIRLWNEGTELWMRALRLPTQGELTRLGRQLTRLEDKLEDVLVAVERLEEQQEALKRAENGRARGVRAPKQTRASE